MVKYTDELKAYALSVAALYEPTLPPLLVGSTVWTGEGRDIDVVVYVGDAGVIGHLLAGAQRCLDGDYPDEESQAYRHGDVNIIAVQDATVWAGWVHAAKLMPAQPLALLQDKSARVAKCEELRAEGEECLSD